MSSTPFTTVLYLPAQAAAEAEATLVSWKVKEGDSFTKGTILAEAESAKASFDFEAPCDGTVKKLLAGEGDSVPFENPVIEVETSDEAMKDAIPQAGQQAAEEPDTEPMAVTAAGHASAHSSDSVYLHGLGGYLPERVVATGELLADIPDTTEEYMIGVTGIRERRWATEEQKPSDMALAAAREALQSAGMKAEELDGIIVTTETPDKAMPATACILQEKLGLRGIPAFDLHAACSGWLYGIVVARGMVLAGVGQNVLVVGVDMQSRLLDKADKGTYFLFGDGSGATIVSSKPGGHRIVEHIITADSKGLSMARRDLPGYAIDHEADPWVRLDGHALFRFATLSFSTLIREVIEKSSWNPEQVRWVVPHQANGRILKAAAKKSGVAFERFYLNIDHVGNTSSASIPLALQEIHRGLQKGDKIVFCSVGAGVTAGAISIEW